MILSLLITLIVFVIIDLLNTRQRQKNVKEMQEIIKHQHDIIKQLTCTEYLE